MGALHGVPARRCVRAYVIYTPRATILELRATKEQGEIFREFARAGISCEFTKCSRTEKAFVEWSSGSRNDVVLRNRVHKLEGGHFDMVCFFGSEVSEYATFVAHLALKMHVQIRNHAEKHSVLDRYLRGWFNAQRVQALRA